MSIQYHALWEILNMGGVHSPSEGQVTIPKRMNFRKSSKWPLLIPPLIFGNVVQTLSTRFGQDFEVEVQARF